MTRRLGREVKVHLEKACESALLAVETYNRPGTKFRSGGYIVLMHIAWTALFHAIFFRSGRKPFYRDHRNPRRYARIGDDYKAWELSECLNQHYGSSNSGVRRNLDFFIGLRNKIEHRSMPALDFHIFGECQALLFNFEDLLFAEFGPKFALNESLSLALQFSQLRNSDQDKVIKSLHRPLAKNVNDYISGFRSSLANDQLHDLQFSYKVFLIPKLANHPGQADLAVEFIKYDPTDPDSSAQYEKLAAVLKPSVMQVANPGRLKASVVARSVQQVVQRAVDPDAKFVASYHHVKAGSFYQIRPKRGACDPRKTKLEYCHFDEAHGDYVYTETWRKFLCHEMRKPGQYERMLREG